MPKRKKPLLHAENIPMPGLDGVNRDRHKEFEKEQARHKGRKKPRRKLDLPPFCPHCTIEQERGERSRRNRVRVDAFGRPLQDCAWHAHKRAYKRLEEMPPMGHIAEVIPFPQDRRR